MDITVIEEVKRLLVGAVCVGVEYAGGLPFIRFDSASLWVGSAWRIVSNEDILAGSDSDDPVKDDVGKVLVGQHILQASVQGQFHDLSVRFDKGLTMETFANSESYENWHVTAGPERMIIAGPGRLWSSF